MVIWLKRLAVGLIITYLTLWCLIWIASPPVSRLLLSDLLSSHQLTLDEDSSIQLNLFRSCLTIDDLSWHQTEKTVFKLEQLEACYSLHRLFWQEVKLEHLTLKGLKATGLVTPEQLIFAGLQLPEATKTEPTQEEVQSQSSPISLVFSAPSIELLDIEFEVTHLQQLHHLKIERLTLENTRYQEGQLRSEIQLVLKLNGAMLESAAKLTYGPEQSWAQLQLSIENLETHYYQYLLPNSLGQQQSKLSLNTQLNAEFKDGALSVISTSVSLRGEQLAFSNSQLQAKLEQFHVALQQLDLSLMPEGHLQLTASPSLDLKDATLDDAGGAGNLLTLAALEVAPAHVQLQGESVELTLPEIKLANIALSSALHHQETLPPLLWMESLQINQTELLQRLPSSKNASASQSSVKIAQIELGKTRVNVVRSKEGEIASLIMPASEPLPEKSVAPEKIQAHEEKSQQVFNLVLETLSFIEPAEVEIDDSSVSPRFKQSLIVEELAVNAVNSKRPEQPAQFHLTLKDKEYFSSTLVGEVWPFKEKVNLNFDYQGTEFPLYQISPYIRESLGFDVLAGQLDSTIKGQVTDSTLDSTLRLKLRGASFEGGSDASTQEPEVIGATAIPLNVALNMLKDDQGHIELKIPIKGDLHDPSFGMQHIVGLVVKKAAAAQAKDYLISTFLPYAQVIKIGMVAGSYALKARFDDLNYQPRQIEPAASQQEFIQQFVALMKEKKELQVKACGVSTPAELTAKPESILTPQQKESLLQLSQQRASAFKKAVVSQGIGSDRILLCVPAIEQGDAKPRLKLSV